jgi:multicomponent Na+:H+ antiporter subunit A
VAAISAAPNAAIDLLVGAVFESTIPAPEGKGFSVAFPTELKPAVVMSIITIAVGAVATPFYGRIHRVVRRLRAIRPLEPNAYYDGFVNGLDRASTLVPRYVQTRRLHEYAAVVLLATVALTLGGYAAAAAALPGFDGIRLGVPLVIVLLVAIVGAIAVDAAPSHVAGVLTLSILGFMVAIFYVLASAPDLALTQLVVETLILVLFLLVLDRLPAWYGEIERSRLVTDSLISGAVGLTVTVTVLLTTSAEPTDGIASFFVERAPVPAEHGPVFTDFGGGSNIVNVILVDFRALDTMGEIAVVAIAALAVLTLVGMRERGETP